MFPPGHPRLRLCSEGPAEAETEALQPPDPSRGPADPVSVAMSRSREDQPLHGHLDHPPQSKAADSWGARGKYLTAQAAGQSSSSNIKTLVKKASIMRRRMSKGSKVSVSVKTLARNER